MARIKNSKHWRPNDPEWYDPVSVVTPPPPLRAWPPESLQVKRRAGTVKIAEEAHCRMCLRSNDVRPLTRHHLIKQEWFRRQSDRVSNLRNCDACIVPLCRPCHDEVERDRYARRLLRRVLSQDEIAFCIAARGKEWFDHRYPSVGAVS